MARRAEIKIPPTVIEYNSHSNIAEAVNNILDLDHDTMIKTLESDEIKEYHKALLSAYQFQTEYNLFMIAMWSKIWGIAIGKIRVKSREFTMDEYARRDMLPTPDNIFDEGYYRIHRILSKGLNEITTIIWISGKDKTLKLGLTWRPEENSTGFKNGIQKAGWIFDKKEKFWVFKHPSGEVKNSGHSLRYGDYLVAANKAASLFNALIK